MVEPWTRLISKGGEAVGFAQPRGPDPSIPHPVVPPCCRGSHGAQSLQLSPGGLGWWL